MDKLNKYMLFSCMVACLLSGGFPAIARDTVRDAGNRQEMGIPVSRDTMKMNSYPRMHNTGTLADFPKIHPLVVHIPVVFLILALITQLVSFMAFKKELSWVTLFLVVFGFAGAYISSTIFHGGDPNLSLLDPVSRHTFEMHKLYAGYTVWISGIAAVAKIISHFLFKRNRVTEILVTLLLAASAYTVIVTGDMGARLVYIDGIGVQGKKIPAHDTM